MKKQVTLSELRKIIKESINKLIVENEVFRDYGNEYDDNIDYDNSKIRNDIGKLAEKYGVVSFGWDNSFYGNLSPEFVCLFIVNEHDRWAKAYLGYSQEYLDGLDVDLNNKTYKIKGHDLGIDLSLVDPRVMEMANAQVDRNPNLEIEYVIKKLFSDEFKKTIIPELKSYMSQGDKSLEDIINDIENKRNYEPESKYDYLRQQQDMRG